MTIGYVLRVALVLLALPLLGEEATAGENARPRGVIELFTSQGCATCPPADKIFEKLANANDLVAIAYHVDYWDYLGWRDTLSNPESTDRQYSYMRAFGTRSVYTPQAVINGRVHVNGGKRGEIEAAFRQLNSSGEGLSVDVSIRHHGDSLIIDAGPAQGIATKAYVMLVFFAPPQAVRMKEGENEGRVITYWNSVTNVQAAGVWRGEATTYEVPARNIPESGGCAVLLQAVGKDGVPGPVLGAASYRKLEAQPRG